MSKIVQLEEYRIKKQNKEHGYIFYGGVRVSCSDLNCCGKEIDLDRVPPQFSTIIAGELKLVTCEVICPCCGNLVRFLCHQT